MERDVASYNTSGDSNKESAVVDMVLGLLCFYYAVFADFPAAARRSPRCCTVTFCKIAMPRSVLVTARSC
jgi:hypothetical protein